MDIHRLARTFLNNPCEWLDGMLEHIKTCKTQAKVIVNVILVIFTRAILQGVVQIPDRLFELVVLVVAKSSQIKDIRIALSFFQGVC